VYELHPGGSDSIGALGYFAAFQEIRDYSQRTGVHFSDIVLSVGSTGTQVGLILGQWKSGYKTRIIGISASQSADKQSSRVYELASSTARKLGIEVDQSMILIDDKFIGQGYAIPSEKGKTAVKIFASMEGLLLDQVYTGKAAAALLCYARKKIFNGYNVLFVHTGGNSGLYY
jgi:1-aminocyclopropane-1-carboxylate deaminase/D-cysteine desulfhydrase-like pyridoxal-dependent ACC family enzyme